MQICPKDCMRMEEDAEGFLYPVIDEEKCIHCGLCERVCSVINRRERTYTEHVYAASSTDEALLKKSSSGGMFGALANYVLKQGGVVFGCSFDEKMELRHVNAQTMEECNAFHGSKYVQSNTRNTFQECKEYLQEGRYVLYVGTPCQIAGLKSYLRKEYDNLLAVELLCHGVPSPGLFRQYLKELEAEKGKKISNVAFRFQDQGWKTYRLKLDYTDGETEVMSGKESAYMAAFFNNLTLRPSCYNCRFRLDYSSGDILIGDFWGIGKYYTEFNEELGVSVLMTLNNKGEKVFAEIKNSMQYVESDLDKVIPANGCVKLSVFPNRNRKKIMEAYGKKEISPLMFKYAPNYGGRSLPYGIGVWGSYNARLVIQFLMSGTGIRRTFHYSNSSITSVMSPSKELEQVVTMENQYRKAALLADWNKSFKTDFEKQTEGTEYILIDLLEERFDLMICDDTILTESDALQDAGIVPKGRKTCQKEALESGIWKEKMQQFVTMLQSKFNTSHMILAEIYMNEKYLDGERMCEFAETAEIRNTNQVLHSLYVLFKECCPEVQVITVPKDLQYTDYEHRYGCYPYHLNYDAYFALADQVYGILTSEEVKEQ